MKLSRLRGLARLCLVLSTTSGAAWALPCEEGRALAVDYKVHGKEVVPPAEARDALILCLADDEGLPLHHYSRTDLRDLSLLSEIALEAAEQSSRPDDFLVSARWILALQSLPGLSALERGQSHLLWARWLNKAEQGELAHTIDAGLARLELCGAPDGSRESCLAQQQQQAQGHLQGARSAFAKLGVPLVQRWTLETDYWEGRFLSSRSDPAGVPLLKKVVREGGWPEVSDLMLPVVARALDWLSREPDGERICRQEGEPSELSASSCSSRVLLLARRLDESHDPGLARRLMAHARYQEAYDNVEKRHRAVHLQDGLQELKDMLDALEGARDSDGFLPSAEQERLLDIAPTVATTLLFSEQRELESARKVLGLQDEADARRWIREKLRTSSAFEPVEVKRLSLLAATEVQEAFAARDPVGRRAAIERAGSALEQLRDPAWDAQYLELLQSGRIKVDPVYILIQQYALHEVHAWLMGEGAASQRDFHARRLERATAFSAELIPGLSATPEIKLYLATKRWLPRILKVVAPAQIELLEREYQKWVTAS